MKFDLNKWANERAQERALHDETCLKDTLVEGFQKALQIIECEAILRFNHRSELQKYIKELRGEDEI